MQDWSEGYVTDIGYTYGYYAEMNPLRARLALLDVGIVPPDVRTACELGFGQGVSINIHDAVSGTDWYGTDFNPAHAGFAGALAGTGPLAGRLSDQAFEEYCNRPDLPDFDFIALHGIWSWVSDANRACIADFIKRKLKVGGVLYVSYNTQPGWAAMAPIKDLLTAHTETMAARGTSRAARIDAALDFAERLLDAGASYGKANPLVAEQVKNLRGQDRNYLAHEYMNRDWMPMPFARMAEWMGSLKLQFASSANYLDHVPMLNLTQEQQAMLAAIPDDTFRETTRDFFVNQRFRRDYWIRGARRLKPLEQIERLRAERVVMVTPADRVKFRVSGALGEATLNRDVYGPVVDTLANHRVQSIGDIERTLAKRGIASGQVLQAIMVLAGAGVLYPAQEQKAVERARPAAKRLNAELALMARSANDAPYLCAPAIGGAVSVGRMEQLFLLARWQGIAEPAGWARFASELLEAQGQRLQAEGKALESVALQLRELDEQAARFAAERLPVLAALGVLG